MGPRHLATLEGEGGRRLLVNEFLEGGTLNVPDLTAKVLRDVGRCTLLRKFLLLCFAWALASMSKSKSCDVEESNSV